MSTIDSDDFTPTIVSLGQDCHQISGVWTPDQHGLILAFHSTYMCLSPCLRDVGHFFILDGIEIGGTDGEIIGPFSAVLSYFLIYSVTDSFSTPPPTPE